MNRVQSTLLIAGMLSVFSVGCVNKASVSDAQLTTDIQSKLYGDAGTRQANVAVAVKDGAVTLSGDVPNSDVELAAMKIANSVNGVHGVSDQMKVNGSIAMNQMPAANLTDTGAASAVAPPVSTPANKKVSRNSEPGYPSATAPVSVPSPDTAPAAPPQSAPEPIAPPRPAAEPVRVTIPAGDRLAGRTVDAIDSGKATDGQTFRASLESPLTANGQVIVPAGAPVTLTISSVRGASRIKGNSELSLQATSLTYRNRNYPVTSSVYSDQGQARGKNTALKTGLGAAAGALIGGLAGGGKGAAIGAGAGGGAGFGYNALTHGKQVKIAPETVLTFRLEDSLTVPAPR